MADEPTPEEIQKFNQEYVKELQNRGLYKQQLTPEEQEQAGELAEDVMERVLEHEEMEEVDDSFEDIDIEGPLEEPPKDFDETAYQPPAQTEQAQQQNQPAEAQQETQQKEPSPEEIEAKLKEKYGFS